jgi:hypothetical protein
MKEKHTTGWLLERKENRKGRPRGQREEKKTGRRVKRRKEEVNWAVDQLTNPRPKDQAESPNSLGPYLLCAPATSKHQVR